MYTTEIANTEMNLLPKLHFFILPFPVTHLRPCSTTLYATLFESLNNSISKNRHIPVQRTYKQQVINSMKTTKKLCSPLLDGAVCVCVVVCSITLFI